MDADNDSLIVFCVCTTSFSIYDQIALLANGEDTAAHAEELVKFKEVRAAAKKAVDELLKREK